MLLDYIYNMKCKYCRSTNCIKRGKRKEIQRYHCKDCNRGFQDSYLNRAYLDDINFLLIKLLQEGSGIRSISRILGISKRTVLSRMLKVSKGIKIPYFDKLGCKFEVDELWSFVGSKDDVVWITYAIEKQTRDVIDFIVGRKTIENIKPLIDKILLLQPIRIYTDRLNIYPSLIPKGL